MFVGTNHLFPKPEHGDDMVEAFHADPQPPITERWDADLFQIARPETGNDYHSTSIWPSPDHFQAWVNSPEFKASHRGLNFGWFTGHPVFVTNDLVMNAEPGRPPVDGSPAPRKAIGAGSAYLFQTFTPADRAAIRAAFVSCPLPTGAIWWELRTGIVRPDEWISVTYYPSIDSVDRTLPLPGDPAWYSDVASSVYVIEVERVPGMSANNRLAVPARH